MGLKQRSNLVHLFDLGLAKLFMNPSTGEHISLREDRVRLGPGTPRYSSANVQLRLGEFPESRSDNHDSACSLCCIDQSRRDDVIALGHTLLFLLHGRLPWQGIFGLSIDWKLVRIGEMKTGGAFREYLARSPSEFATYFDHCRGLAFEEKPDYALLKRVFRDRMEREGWEYDLQFDWMDGRPLEKGTLISDEYVLDVI